MRFQEGSGQFDPRDYHTKAKPLSFDHLAEEWLALKAGQIKVASWRSIASGLRKAVEAWGGTNIKNIQYPQLEDFISQCPGAPKSRANALAALKQFWQWAVDRYEIPPIKKWPRLGHVEMAFRDTVDLHTQEAILEDIRHYEPFKVWLCIKWLATYIAVRPSEMSGLTESQVDRQRGILIFPHPKEKRAKIIPLVVEDLEIVRALPFAFDQFAKFFRHEGGVGGTKAGEPFGHSVLYRAWRRACHRLGIPGVYLPRHQTFHGHGAKGRATPEEIKSMTLHSTSEAFHRYFQTSGEALRELQSRRRQLVEPDNRLITKSAQGEGGI